ncbi:MAG: tetratricopeptide repeat protein [Flavobacteriales bacterium]
MRKIAMVLGMLFQIALTAQVDTELLWRIWSDKRNNDTVRLKALSDFAWQGYLFSEPDSAIHYGQMMYDHAARKGMKREMAYALRGQGVAYKVRDENVKALDLFLRSMALSEEAGDLPGIAGSLNNIGILYFEQGDYARSLDYHKRSLDMRIRSGDLKGIGASLNSIGKIHEKRGEPDRALQFFMRALNSGQHLKFDLGTAYTLINIGGIHRGRGEREQALKFYHAGLELHRRSNDRLAEAMDRNLIGATHLEEGDVPSAIVECGKALALTKGLNNLEEQRNACDCLYEAYRSVGDRFRALEFLERSRTISDSLKDERIAMKLQRMEFNFELRLDSIAAAEEERHVELLSQAAVEREKSKKNIFLAVGVGILLVSIGLYSRVRYISRAKREAEVLQERAEAGERAKQQFLANMSHEIRTPMNAIMGMTDLLLRNDHGAAQKKYLEAIKLSSENLLMIINDILDLSKIDAGRVETLSRWHSNSRTAIAGVMAILQLKAEERGLSLLEEVAASVPAVPGWHPGRLHQVSINLVGTPSSSPKKVSSSFVQLVMRGEMEVANCSSASWIPVLE